MLSWHKVLVWELAGGEIIVSKRKIIIFLNNVDIFLKESIKKIILYYKKQVENMNNIYKVTFQRIKVTRRYYKYRMTKLICIHLWKRALFWLDIYKEFFIEDIIYANHRFGRVCQFFIRCFSFCYNKICSILLFFYIKINRIRFFSNYFGFKVLSYMLKSKKNIWKFYRNSNTEFSLIIFLLILSLFINLSYLNVPMVKFINKYFIISILVYTLLTGFLFLKKLYRFGKYTSQIQRFWKRSYILFWLIELFLFIFFTYLLLTHFTESTYFLDLKPLVFSSYTVTSYWVFQNIVIFSIIYLNYSAIIFLKNNNYQLINLVFIIINCLALFIFYNEFYRFFYAVNYYYNNLKMFNYYNKKNIYVGLNSIDTVFKTRTMLHYSGLVIFLKFWHFVFIYLFYLFVCGKLDKNEISYDSLSSNLQNFIFYLFFNMLIYVFMFKNFCIFYFTEIYYWFFTGSQFKGMYYVFIEMFSIFKYIIL